jgi:hypothetical protein
MGTVAGRGYRYGKSIFRIENVPYGFRQNGSVNSGPGRPIWPQKIRGKCKNFIFEELYGRLKASSKA